MGRDGAGQRPGVDRWQLAGAYVGSVIGAGFASGQEHLQFFLSFGKEGYWGLVLAGLMFTIFGGLFLRLAYEYRTQSHTELLRACSSPPLTGLFDHVLTLFLLVSLSVMMAGGGALLERVSSIPPLGGSVSMGLATFAIVTLRVDRMLHVNGVITAALIILIVSVGATTWSSATREGVFPPVPSVRGWVPGAWPASALLYGAYNLALSFTFFGALGAEIRSGSEAWGGGLIGGVALTVLSFAVCLAVGSAMPHAAAYEIPMLAVLRRMHPAVQVSYFLAIWGAMLTTAVASSYALTRRLTLWTGSRQALVAAFVILTALPLAAADFSHLVSTIYPVIGYVGAGCLLLTALHSKKAER